MTEAELAVLSLLIETPRHRYQIEQVIEERGMREWTAVGFSSIYYLLRKLEKKNLTGDKWAEVSNTTHALSKATVFINPTEDLSFSYVESSIKELLNSRGAISWVVLTDEIIDFWKNDPAEDADSNISTLQDRYKVDLFRL